MMMVTAEQWTRGDETIEIRGYFVPDTQTAMLCVSHFQGEGDERKGPVPFAKADQNPEAELIGVFGPMLDKGRQSVCQDGITSAAHSVHYCVETAQCALGVLRDGWEGPLDLVKRGQ